MTEQLKQKILDGGSINRKEALGLISAPLEELCRAADEIRARFCGSSFDLCSIINAKSGKCPENCRYCAQSAHYCGVSESYPLISAELAAHQAEENRSAGIMRFSLVTSGRALTDNEIESVCGIISKIKSTCDISVCGSFGLLSEEQFRTLKSAGLTRVHNNLETSRHFFPQVCTTHTYDDKLRAIEAAQRAGLEVCSGGIMGLGETFEDRIDMALELRNLGIKSIPINMLNPIKGTPFENNDILTGDEMRRICAVFRFINPRAHIRLAGGRGIMPDRGECCFRSGANAAITMNMLTTSGVSADEDIQLIGSLGFKV